MEEEILKGGENSSSIVRIGNYVHRSSQGNRKLYNEVLKHLESHGFRYSPKIYGLDDSGRDILSFIPGSTMLGIPFSLSQLQACVRILKEFHDYCSLLTSKGVKETICHRDFSPWNVIFLHEMPVGIIDFDEVTPGNRIEDFAYFLWTFLDIGQHKKEDDLLISIIHQLAQEYSGLNISNLSEKLVEQQERILEFRKSQLDPSFSNLNKDLIKSRVNSIKESIMWVKSHASQLNKT